jgi:ribosome-binding factor A
MSRRIQRLNVLFREELASLMRTELRDPRVSEMVSITRVDVSPDLENADVHVSVMGEPEEQLASIRALEHAAPFLRRELLPRVSIRKVPHLKFHLDRSIEEAARVLELMKQVEKRGSGPPD